MNWNYVYTGARGLKQQPEIRYCSFYIGDIKYTIKYICVQGLGGRADELRGHLLQLHGGQPDQQTKHQSRAKVREEPGGSEEEYYYTYCN